MRAMNRCQVLSLNHFDETRLPMKNEEYPIICSVLFHSDLLKELGLSLWMKLGNISDRDEKKQTSIIVSKIILFHDCQISRIGNRSIFSSNLLAPF